MPTKMLDGRMPVRKILIHLRNAAIGAGCAVAGFLVLTVIIWGVNNMSVVLAAYFNIPVGACVLLEIMAVTGAVFGVVVGADKIRNDGGCL